MRRALGRVAEYKTAQCGRSRVGPTLRCSFPKADIDRSGSIVMEKPRHIRTESGINEHLGRHKSVTGPDELKPRRECTDSDRQNQKKLCWNLTTPQFIQISQRLGILA